MVVECIHTGWLYTRTRLSLPGITAAHPPLISTLLVYPNPVSAAATLEYDLWQNGTITILLFDLQGRALRTFIQEEEQSVGPRRETIHLPEDLPAGHCVLCISNAQGRVSIQVVK